MKFFCCGIFLCLSTLSTYVFAGCKTGWSAFGNICYYVDTSAIKTYAACSTQCAALGAQMLCIKSDAQQTAYQTLAVGLRNVWIGYNDIQTEGQFQWQSGCSSTYTHWFTGEPNDWSNNEDCGYMHQSQNGFWADLRCDGYTFGVYCACEYDSTPTQSPTTTPTNAPTYNPSRAPSFSPTCTPTCNPTSTPTIMPTFKPSTSPTVEPTTVPTLKPTAGPTFHPTNSPTFNPTTTPTVSPTSSPTVNPTTAPTFKPTIVPTFMPTSGPSGTPTSAPSQTPSSIPSSGPTGEPTSMPSEVPTTSPTDIPTSSPSGEPTCEPTLIPSGDPSSQPTIIPTAWPTNVPTGMPTEEPTSVPTNQPTAEPSTVPTGQPSFNPSGEPTPMPTSGPSCEPTTAPTGIPTSNPSFEPSGNPTALPSGTPSSEPSGNPTALPSGTPSSEPSGNPTALPSGTPSSEPSGNPTAVPSSGPSSEPSREPTSLPTRPPNASNRPTALPTTMPSGEPTSAPTFAAAPVVQVLSVIPNRTFADITVSLDSSGTMYCAAFPANSDGPSSVHSVIVSGFSTSIDATSLSGSIRVSDLTPVTTYHIYCVATSIHENDVWTTFAEMRQSAVDVTTSCCKELHVFATSSWVVEGMPAVNFLQISLQAAPSEDMKLDLVVLAGDVLVRDVLIPDSLTLSNLNWQSPQFISLKPLAVGQYSFHVTASGPVDAEYGISHDSPLVSFTVYESSVEPPVVSIKSATFSKSGLSFSTTFSGNTDGAHMVTPFTCSFLLDFPGASEAVCSWNDATTLVATLSGDVLVGLEDNVTLKTGILRAQCVLSSDICGKWSTSSGGTVHIGAPVDGAIPEISLNFPSSVGRCNSPVIDISSSTGSGGRNWKAFDVFVTGDNLEAASKLQTYLATSMKPSLPTTVPSSYLQAAQYFDIEVSLCSFLKLCGKMSRRMKIVASELSVTIQGQQKVVVRSDDQLLLKAQASWGTCETITASQQTLLTWAVKQNDVVVSSLVSTSRDPTLFKLPPFSLTPAATYEVLVSVGTSFSKNLATASVIVTVSPLSLTAVIQGGAIQSAPLAEAFLLDASKTYFSNGQATTGLSFTWTCMQKSPTVAAQCPFSIISVDAASAAVVSLSALQDASKIGSTYGITVTATDGKIGSTASVVIVITASNSPKVKFVSTLTQKINPSDSLLLRASVDLTSPATAEWLIGDDSTMLLSAAKTPVKLDLVAGSSIVNLALRRSSMVGRVAPYKFSLSVGVSTATILVTVNMPPLVGELLFSPSSGQEMDTVFTFSASRWADDDLPLTYQFGYMDDGDYLRVVRDKSVLSYGQSVLPAGSSNNNNHLTCFVAVSDSFNANSSRSTHVTVSKRQWTSNLAYEAIYAALDHSYGQVDETKSVLAVMGTILNYPDCTLVPDCALLGRFDCSRVDNTCGACLDGLIGPRGDDNSLCLDASLVDNFKSFKASGECTLDNQCSGWEICDKSVNLCVQKSRECSEGCGHGRCVYRSTSTDQLVDSCFISDTSCAAVCICDEGYGGPMCSQTNDELAKSIAAREALVTRLLELSSSDDISEDSILLWVQNLQSLTEDPLELSSSAVNDAMDILQIVLTHANTLGVSADKLFAVMNALDATTTASKRLKVGGESHRRLASGSSDLTGFLDTYGHLLAKDMVDGDGGIDMINTNFRMSTRIVKTGEKHLPLPQTPTELALGVQASHVQFLDDRGTEESSVSTSIVLTSQAASLFMNSGTEYTTNPLRLLFGNQYMTHTRFVIVMKTNVPQDYVYFPGNGTINTTCTEGEVANHTKTCYLPENMGAVQHVHQCLGTSELLSTPCPGIRLLPTCTIMEGSEFECSVVDFTSTSTTCNCSLLSDDGSRRLGFALTSGVLQLATASEFVVDEFAATLSTAGDFNSPKDLSKVIIVLVLFGTLWSLGAIAIAGFTLRSAKLSREDKIKSKQQAEANKSTPLEDIDLTVDRDAAANRGSTNIVAAKLINYVDSVFPAVYQGRWWGARMSDELFKHHRYMLLFRKPKESNGEGTRVVTAMQLLSVQSMLMFILAVLYDMQFPSDDGTCATYSTKNDCLREVSPIDSSTNVCKWSSSECVYNDSQINLRTVVIMSVLVATFTAPVNIIIDFLFNEILSAPTADDEKKVALALQEGGRARQALRRASNAVRRASAASLQAVSKVKSRAFSTFAIQSTRSIPKDTVAAQAEAAMLSEEFSRSAKIALDSSEELTQVKRSKSLETIRMRKQTRKTIARRENYQPDDGNGIIEERMMEFEADLAEQRKVLKQSLREGFDLKWGIDPVGEFAKQKQSFLFCLRGSERSAEDCIKGEMAIVQKLADEKFEKLRVASNSQVGLELLHLLVLDILGRDTPVARIFERKSEEDYRHVMVVTKTVKILAWIMVAILNLFFVYFALLRGLERGERWQRLYAGACALQLVIEIFVYETSECLTIHYFIPSLVRTEVQSAGFALRRVIQQICSNREDGIPVILDATRYLYVSTNVAKRFPNLIESAVILSYRTYLPGESSRKWRFEYAASEEASGWMGWRRSTVLKNISINAFVVNALQVLGAQSPVLQRALIHTIQPALATLLLLTMAFIVKHPLYSLVWIPIVVYASYRIYDQSSREQESMKSGPVGSGSASAITPRLQSSSSIDPSSLAVMETHSRHQLQLPYESRLREVHSELSLPRSSSVAPSACDDNDDSHGSFSLRSSRSGSGRCLGNCDESKEGPIDCAPIIASKEHQKEDECSDSFDDAESVDREHSSDWCPARCRVESTESVDSCLFPYSFSNVGRPRNFSYSSDDVFWDSLEYRQEANQRIDVYVSSSSEYGDSNEEKYDEIFDASKAAQDQGEVWERISESSSDHDTADFKATEERCHHSAPSNYEPDEVELRSSEGAAL